MEWYQKTPRGVMPNEEFNTAREVNENGVTIETTNVIREVNSRKVVFMLLQ